MKIIFCISIILAATLLHAQIPNAGFESWHDDSAGIPPFIYQEPDGWHSFDSTDATNAASSVVQEPNAHQGNFAAKIQTANYGGPDSYAGVLTLLNPYNGTGGVPASQKYLSFNGWFYYDLQAGDSLYVISNLFYNSSGAKTIIAVASGVFTGSQSGYNSFSLPFHYYRTNTPDSMDVLFVVGKKTQEGFLYGALGSYAVVDELSLTAIPNGVPTAPIGLIAAAASNDSISLVWQDHSNNETGFIIERSFSQYSGFVPVDSVSANVETFTDRGLTDGVTYYYQVNAFNANGNSATSNIASAVAGEPTGISAPSFESQVLIYPNPANDVVNIVLPVGLNHSQIILFNATGKQVLHKTADEETSIQLNLNKLPTGNYFLKIENENAVAIKLLLIQ